MAWTCKHVLPESQEIWAWVVACLFQMRVDVFWWRAPSVCIRVGVTSLKRTVKKDDLTSLWHGEVLHLLTKKMLRIRNTRKRNTSSERALCTFSNCTLGLSRCIEWCRLQASRSLPVLVTWYENIRNCYSNFSSLKGTLFSVFCHIINPLLAKLDVQNKAWPIFRYLGLMLGYWYSSGLTL